MTLAHKIALDPTPTQAKFFAKAAGVSRFAWNWALERWNLEYREGKKPNGFRLKKQLNAIKREQFPWMLEVHRDAAAQPFTHLQRAFERFFRGEARRPTFKKKRLHDSFYVANDKCRVKGRHVVLPKVGRVRMREVLRFQGKLCGATVSRDAGRWFIAFQVEVGEYQKERSGNSVVGVDLGVKDLATLSTGEKIPGPKALAKTLTKLRRLSRRLSRKQKGSSNYKKAAITVAQCHRRIKNMRQDYTHKLTTRLCRENQTVVIENLAVKNMAKNRRLTRVLSDASLGELRRQLTYKALIFMTFLAVADRWFPSSKRCSRCGYVKDSLLLSERSFRCDACGHIEDRDTNAARNLEHLGWATPEDTPVERGALVRCAHRMKLPSGKQEPNRVHACTQKG